MDGDKEGGRDNEENEPSRGIALFDVKETLDSQNGKATWGREGKLNSVSGVRRGGEGIYIYRSLVKFQRKSGDETNERTREQHSSSSSSFFPIDCSLRPAHGRGPSFLPRKVETRQKSCVPPLPPPPPKFSIGRTGKASSGNKGDFVLLSVG